MKNINYQFIRDLYKKKGYVFFEQNYNMNLFGIRGNSTEPDRFNDWIGVAYNNKVFLIPATVDPGIPWMVTPMNRIAAAAIVEGQYRKVWKMGIFKGAMALIQVGNFKIYRDGNKNNIFDYDPKTIVNSPYTDGIFLHPHFQGIEEATTVGRSSAGCVVPQKNSDYIALFQILSEQRKANYGDVFTFTLFHETDFTG